MSNEKKGIHDLLEFIDNSPTPFHAVEEMKSKLIEQGYSELKESDAWELTNNSKHFVTRNDSSLIAFIVGTKTKDVSGFKIIGAHTDSPNLKQSTLWIHAIRIPHIITSVCSNKPSNCQYTYLLPWD